MTSRFGIRRKTTGKGAKPFWTMAAAIVVIVVGVAAFFSARPEVVMQPVGEVRGVYFKDVTGEDLDSDSLSQFSYRSSEVLISYPRWSPRTFEISIEAKGLKPNFCYQVRLEGIPEKIWSTGGNDRTNEALGLAGGWWRIEPQPGPATDVEYRRNRENPLNVYGGFLMIDFVVTDGEGRARLLVKADNSFVQARRIADRPRSKGDGVLEAYEVEGSRVELYGERLGGRVAAGQVALPRGRHDLQISLTEETFGEAAYEKVLAGSGHTFRIGF